VCQFSFESFSSNMRYQIKLKSMMYNVSLPSVHSHFVETGGCHYFFSKLQKDGECKISCALLSMGDQRDLITTLYNASLPFAMFLGREDPSSYSKLKVYYTGN
jgi:hypothetical protein